MSDDNTAVDTEVPMVPEKKADKKVALPEAADTDLQPVSPKKIQRKSAKPAEISSDAQLLFGKYSVSGLAVDDPSLASYIKLSKRPYPNIFGRRKYQAYYNAHTDIVERFISKLMRGGTGKKISGKVIRRKGALQGKKLKVVHMLQESFDIINKKTGKNPVQVLINALQNAAPIEDTTRVRYGGISYNVAVGISSQRRLDVALRNLALAGLMGAFKNKRTLSDALANEILLAASKSPDSYAIKKRVEAERIAKRAR